MRSDFTYVAAAGDTTQVVLDVPARHLCLRASVASGWWIRIHPPADKLGEPFTAPTGSGLIDGWLKLSGGDVLEIGNPKLARPDHSLAEDTAPAEARSEVFDYVSAADTVAAIDVVCTADGKLVGLAEGV